MTDLPLLQRTVQSTKVGAEVRVRTYHVRGSLVASICDEAPLFF